MQPAVRLSVFATCLALAACGGDDEQPAKQPGANCMSNADCIPAEQCLGAFICPSSHCSVPNRPGTCNSRASCFADRDCQNNEVCVQVAIAILPPPLDAGSATSSFPGECRHPLRAARPAAPPLGGDAWWGAAESAMNER